MVEKEVSIGKIVKFFTIVTLDKSNGKAKMSGNVALKIEENSVHIRFVSKWESPNIMSEIIQYDKVIFEARYTQGRGCP